eukprot:704396-Amphidinium_carterae.2
MEVCSHFLVQISAHRSLVRSECLSDTPTPTPVTWSCGYSGVRVGEATHPGPPHANQDIAGPRHRLGRKQRIQAPLD